MSNTFKNTFQLYDEDNNLLDVILVAQLDYDDNCNIGIKDSKNRYFYVSQNNDKNLFNFIMNDNYKLSYETVEFESYSNIVINLNYNENCIYLIHKTNDIDILNYDIKTYKNKIRKLNNEIVKYENFVEKINAEKNIIEKLFSITLN